MPKTKKKTIDTKWFLKKFNIKEKDINKLRISLTEKLEFLVEVIEPFIFGTESYVNWIEIRMLSEKEKKNLFEIYKKLKNLVWKSYSIGVSNVGIKGWLSDFKKFWTENEKFIVDIFNKISEGWLKYNKNRRDEERKYYVG